MPKAKSQDILNLLKTDHTTVKKILEELSKTTTRGVKAREKLFAKLQHEIQLHTKVEEELLYPRLKVEKITKDLALESYEEHAIVDHLLNEIAGVDPADETWLPKLNVLQENLLHHIKEEENDMFPKVKKILDTLERQQLAEEMLNIKQAILF